MWRDELRGIFYIALKDMRTITLSRLLSAGE
jgi:hypothetical protein